MRYKIFWLGHRGYALGNGSYRKIINGVFYSRKVQNMDVAVKTEKIDFKTFERENKRFTNVGTVTDRK